CEAAEALANEAFQIGSQSGEPDALFVYARLINAIRIYQGRDSELVDAVAATADVNPGIPMIRAVVARMRIDAGRREQARQLLEAETTAGLDLPRDPAQLSGLALWAYVAARLGGPAVEMLYHRLAPWPEHVAFNGINASGAVAHYLGLLAAHLGHYDTAEAHFVQAQAIHEQLDDT